MALEQAKFVETERNVWHAAVAAIDALALAVKRGQVNGQLSEVRELLEAPPLASGDFCRAANNLKNAERYLRSQEAGAAGYELRMLAGVIRNSAAVSSVAPRYRPRLRQN